MKHRIRKGITIVMICIAATIPFGFANSNFEITKNLDIYITLFKQLNSFYVDEIEPSKLMRTGIDAMLESLDPYTNFISEAEIENHRYESTGKYGGIGAAIRFTDKYVVITDIYEGFAADKAGLQIADEIIEVKGVSTEGKNSTEVSSLLKGQAGTEVKLTVRRPDLNGESKEIKVTLVREDIKVDNVPYYGMLNDSVGYIKLAGFTDNAGKEVKDALIALKADNDNLSGIVFDLRGNPGGLLNEAVNVTNVFVPKDQLVVSTKGKTQDWDKSFNTRGAPIDTKIRLTVLTNKGSASASEIVSGSIQDLDRGVIVGQRSFGKGLVQTTKQLSYNTLLKLTIAKYYIPSGRCIQAINYAERNEDGSVKRVPDSLKTAFTTGNGRVVYDGGGILPDVQVERRQLSNISFSLLSKSLIFDYATQYHLRHETIDEAMSFELTDADYDAFISFLSDKEYDYTTSSESLLDKLEEAAKDEKYYEGVQADIEDLKKSIKHDKEKDLIKHKDEIKQLLEVEIAGRYYHSRGRIEAQFDEDKEVIEAINTLANINEYKTILNP